MRLIALLTLVPGLALADEIALPTPVSEATFYASSVTLTRTADVTLDAGTHRLLIPYPAQGARGLPQVTLDGAAVVAMGRVPGGLVDGRPLLDAAQRDAVAVWEAAIDARNAARDAADQAQAGAEAAAAQLGFWRSISGGALTGLEPDALTATAGAVAQGVAQAQAEQIAARAAVREANDRLDATDRAVAQARAEMAALAVRLDAVDVLALDVVAAADGPVSLTLEQVSPGGWQPRYDAILDEEAESLRLVRRVQIFQQSGLAVADATVVLSTADPGGRVAPSDVLADRADIRGEADAVFSRSAAPQASLDMAEMRVQPVESAVAVAGTPMAGAPVLTYGLPQPVTVPGGNDGTIVTLGTLDLDVRVFARAAPRFDDFAYLMAEAADGPTETLLPGPVTRYRDGTRVGDAQLALVPAGDSFELGFGPLRDLPLKFVALDNATGERGFFSTSGTRVQEMAFRVRNLSAAPQEVETIYALPFSEEEALELSVRATPQPDVTDLEDARGVSRWDLTVAPGEEAEVRLRVQATWPEGQVLDWRP